MCIPTAFYSHAEYIRVYMSLSRDTFFLRSIFLSNFWGFRAKRLLSKCLFRKQMSVVTLYSFPSSILWRFIPRSLWGVELYIFYLLIVTLPNGTTHVFIMKNKLSFWHQKELPHWAAGLPSLQKSLAILSVHWALPEGWRGGGSVGNSVLCKRTSGKNKTANVGTH